MHCHRNQERQRHEEVERNCRLAHSILYDLAFSKATLDQITLRHGAATKADRAEAGLETDVVQAQMVFPMLRTLLFSTIVLLSPTLSIAAQSGWKFELDDREQPGLQYVENGRSVFHVGCGRAFGIHAVYPGPHRKVGAKATVTLSNTKQQIVLKGEIEETPEDDQPGSTQFVQWDLGFKRQDPALFGPGWKKLEDRLFDLLDSGKPLTLSAEGRRYVLPPVDSPQWKARFKEKC